MKILLIKTSSLGDVLHTFPAITDLALQHPNLELTWVVEEAFAPMAKWHPAVKTVLPVAIRRWRKKFSRQVFAEIRTFIKLLRQERYDYIIDAQGLLKSALIAVLAKGKRYGLDKHSAREPLASFFYQHCFPVDKNQHAIWRVRSLFAKAVGYHVSSDPTQLDYGITIPAVSALPFTLPSQYLIFLHATTWITKLYPEPYWKRLIQLANTAGYTVILPWGNLEEKNRSERLSENTEASVVPPKLNFSELAFLLQQSRGVISVDTGIGHLAAALSVPTLSLYGPTDPTRTGTLGNHQVHLAATFECAPCLQKQCTYRGESPVFPACFATLAPEKVWEKFLEVKIHSTAALPLVIASH